MPAKRRSLTPILIGVALLAIVVLMILASQQRGPAFTGPALPNPNGYDDLQQAAKLLAPRTGFYDEMEEAELQAIVEQNEPALELVNEALTKQIAVPIDWTADPGSDAALRLNDVTSLRSISRALAAQTRWSRLNRDLSAALDSARKTFQLGTMCGHQGILNDYYVGIAIQGMGLDALRHIDTSDDELLNTAMGAVLTIQDEGETSDAVISREREYINSNLTGFKGWIMRDTLLEHFDSGTHQARDVEFRVIAQSNLLLLNLALHRYQLLHGEWPASLDELPAAMLSLIPVDPFSSKPFIYRVTDDGYQLYSVGENRIDDGGRTDEDGLQPDLFFDLVPTQP